MTYASPILLQRRHDVSSFDCGEPALNDWLQRHALGAQASDSARVFVTTLDGTDDVVGYYALATAAVEPQAAPPRIGKGQPANRPIPAVVLARFAVDLEHQGQGVGQSLLRDVLQR